MGKQADVTNTSICDGGAAGGTWCSSVNAQGGRIKAKEGRSGNNLLGRLPPKPWHSWEQDPPPVPSFNLKKRLPLSPHCSQTAANRGRCGGFPP